MIVKVVEILLRIRLLILTVIISGREPVYIYRPNLRIWHQFQNSQSSVLEYNKVILKINRTDLASRHM